MSATEPVSSDLCCLLTDNGSHRPESTLSLRKLAGELSKRVDHHVSPVSLLHSTKVDPAKLDGEPASIFEPFLKKQIEAGVSSFLVVPMFFGPSAAITEYLPQRVAAIRESHPQVEVRVAPCVVDRFRKDDSAMAEILLDLARKKADEAGLDNPALTITDHGTPRESVTEVRNMLANQIRSLAGEKFCAVEPSSMERREGPDYDFNEPLLENLLGREGFQGDVIVAMLFASPGRHAGPGGDIASICEESEKKHPGLRTMMTDLVATHPRLMDILVERFHQGVESSPIEGELVM